MYRALKLHDPAAKRPKPVSRDASPNERGHVHGSATFCCSVLLAARNEIGG